MHRRKKGPTFKMKSGNKTTFKMMGSTSPVKQTDPPADNEAYVPGSRPQWSVDQYLQAGSEYNKLKENIDKSKTAQERRTALDELGSRYGLNPGELRKGTDKKGDTYFMSPEGVSVSDLEKDYFKNKEVNPKYVQKKQDNI